MIFPPGVFTKIFERPHLGDALAAVACHGFAHTQFNLSCAGLASLPDEIGQELQHAIQAEFSRYSLNMAAVSGTYNMINPDPLQRQAGLDRLRTLVEACRGLGTRVITLCTGTRHPTNMWHSHPENNDPSAWVDLLTALEAVLPLAEARGVTLAFEPEPANVIDHPAKGRRLLDELHSPNLKVVMDAANLFHPGELDRIPEIFRHAFDQLGGDIVLAHAKDLNLAGEVVAAGKGVLDYPLYIQLLQETTYTGPLILHSLTEEEVPGSLAFLSALM